MLSEFPGRFFPRGGQDHDGVASWHAGLPGYPGMQSIYRYPDWGIVIYRCIPSRREYAHASRPTLIAESDFAFYRLPGEGLEI